MPPRLKIYIHFTKSIKRDNIYKLCLYMYMLEEYNYLILISLHIPKLRYRANAKKCKPGKFEVPSMTYQS